MSNKWTDEENKLIIDDYFEMLEDDLLGRPINKAEHNRRMQQRLGNRTKGSIEYKHQNITAILNGLGEISLSGYPPMTNYQRSLEDAVVKRLTEGRRVGVLGLDLKPPSQLNTGLADIQSAYGIEAKPIRLLFGPAPTQQNKLPSKDLQKIADISRRYRVAERDAQNRQLGKAGERLVFLHERQQLLIQGRQDLAKQVRWVAEEDGDGYGYDIRSFDEAGEERFIEVKTTCGWGRTPFYITENELHFSDECRDKWRLTRVWDFRRQPKAFELFWPLRQHADLVATLFRVEMRS